MPLERDAIDEVVSSWTWWWSMSMSMELLGRWETHEPADVEASHFSSNDMILIPN